MVSYKVQERGQEALSNHSQQKLKEDQVWTKSDDNQVTQHHQSKHQYKNNHLVG